MSIYKPLDSSFYEKIPFPYQVSLKRFPRYELFTKNGFLGFTTSAEQDIWSEGGILQKLTTAELMVLVSTDPLDDSTGLGAQIVLINGLDQNYNKISEVLVLEGTTPVVGTIEFLRISAIIVVQTGANNQNAGTIRLTSNISLTVQASILPGRNISSDIHATVPAGKVALVHSVSLGVAGGNDTLFKVKLQNPKTGGIPLTTGTFASRRAIDLINFPTPFLLEEKTDFTISIEVTGPTTIGSAAIFWDLVDKREVV